MHTRICSDCAQGFTVDPSVIGGLTIPSHKRIAFARDADGRVTGKPAKTKTACPGGVA